MLTFLLVVHLLVTLGMVASILLQRSEGGGFVSSASSFMSARGSANFLTRLTAIFATLFIFLSLVLAILAGGHSRKSSIVDGMEATQQSSVPPASEAVPEAPVPAGEGAAKKPSPQGTTQGKK